jgi:Patatin-like phospholipase
VASSPIVTGRRDQLFPAIVPDPPDRTFELGLVLGGTVSAGAYTAGALDFLLEALEAWQADAEPLHRVIVKTAAGTSGGAVCAAILGLLSSRKVPHVGTDAGAAAAAVDTGNPLWDLWVNQFQITRLMQTDDLNEDADLGSGAVVKPIQHVPSLIDCRMIDEAAAKLAAIGNTPWESLAYFTAPFRIAVTMANLRGVPYQILDVPTLGEFSGAAFVQHDDFAWFAFPNGASPVVTADSLGKREDEFWLGAGESSGFVGYDTLAAYAMASAAMPVGLAARALARPREHYHHRPRVRPMAQPPGYRIDWPEPDWTGLPDAEQTGVYSCTCVDGGTFNNDPVGLVHRALAGLIGINPRGKSDAKRAIFMIDPLADELRPIARTGKSLVSVVENIIGTVVGGSRYLTADMELFADEDVFSRFQLVPFRPEHGKVGEAALAGTSLYAAAGWCARAFRVHDFLLGRQNMQTYLRKEFVLAGDNPLFAGWQLGDRRDWALDNAGNRIDVQQDTPGNAYFLPVIPDKTGEAPLLVPDWPVGAFNPADLAPMLKKRLAAVVEKLVADNGGGGALPWLIGVFAVPGVVDFVTSRVVGSFKQELTEAGLWK